MRASGFSFLLWAFSSFVIAASPEAVHVDAIILERTSCYGTCPVYKVTLQRDGKVAYDGKEFVKVTGHRTRKIPPEHFQQLAREVEQIGFFGFKAEYRYKRNPDGSAEFVTDMPTRFTTVQAGKLRKRVVNYYGGPQSLERLIDKISGSSEWTGRRPNET